MAKRLKTPAADAPQTRDQVAARIRRLGDAQREQARLVAEMNDQVAEITERYQPGIDAFKLAITSLLAEIKPWCESHRADLTDGYRVKSANLITGEVGWRADPPSVAVKGVDAVMALLEQAGLDVYIRTRREIDKAAILADRSIAASAENQFQAQSAERLERLSGIPGISVREGVEQFFITPFEQSAD